MGMKEFCSVFSTEYYMLAMSVFSVFMIFNFSFLVSIINLLVSSLLLSLMVVKMNNLMFGLIVLLVYVSGLLLVFMYVSTMMSLWQKVLKVNFYFLMGLIICKESWSSWKMSSHNWGVMDLYMDGFINLLLGGLILSITLVLMLELVVGKGIGS